MQGQGSNAKFGDGNMVFEALEVASATAADRRAGETRNLACNTRHGMRRSQTRLYSAVIGNCSSRCRLGRGREQRHRHRFHAGRWSGSYCSPFV